jgi:acyl-CoA thioesterase
MVHTAGVDHTFATDSAVESLGDGLYRVEIQPRWRVVTGSHGGYISGIILRALSETVNDAGRAARSYTTHFLNAPQDGPAEIRTTVERAGRSMSFVSARMEQDGKPIALSLAAFSSPRESFSFDDTEMPEVGPPESGFPVPREGEGVPPFLKNFDMKWLIGGAPFSGAPDAELGGWFRLDPPVLADAPVVACLLDAWAPAIFPRATDRVVCPTIDLTMHFRAPLPHPGATPDTFYLGRFWSRLLRDGFFEEEGELWASDGTLLAQSRQLALAIEPKKH